MNKLIFYFSAVLLVCASYMFADNAIHHKACNDQSIKKEKLARIFPFSEQVSIQADGLYVCTPNMKLLRAKYISFIDNKLCVFLPKPKLIAKRGPCGLHAPYHRKLQGCGGCGVLLCPMNCTCFD